MEGVAIITYSTYVKEVGIVKYENEEIIILVKPKVARILFGKIGETVASYKELCRIGIGDIASMSLKEKGAKKLYVVLQLNTGKKCKLFFKSKDEIKNVFLSRFDGKVAEN